MSIAETIRQNRFHDFVIPVEAGSARSARVHQKSHDFFFGTAAFALVRDPDAPTRPKYEALLQRLLNFTTLPFYWGSYEPFEGKPMEQETLAAAQWANKHHFTTKGHPLCWHTACADWLMEYDNDTILAKQLDRIRRDVSLYRGKIDMWDVINEVVIMPTYDRYDNAITRIANHIGAVELTDRCFRAAREANPDAVLLINDFDLSVDYERLIEQLLDRGTPIDVIGLQSHQHQGYDGAEATMEFIDRFARFGLPLHFTEVSILSGDYEPRGFADLNDIKLDEWPTSEAGEERQLQQVEEYYSAIFSRLETGAIVWWSPTDGGWLDAPSGLIRKDLTPKPAFLRLEELIKGEWWLNETEIAVDSDDAIRFSGAAGSYVIEIAGDRHEIHLPISEA